jgi:glutamyl-tRNA synthetase
VVEQHGGPAAFINMLAFLGWNPGTTQEIFSLEQLCEAFSLDRVSKAGAKFDADKTKWFQQHYLRSTTDIELASELRRLTTIELPQEKLIEICRLMKERATFVSDILSEGRYLLDQPKEYDTEIISKKWKSETTEFMKDWLIEIEKLQEFTAHHVEIAFKDFLASKNVGIGAVLLPFRLLVTGVGMGPGMFEIASFLGKEEVIERMNSGLSYVESLVK